MSIVLYAKKSVVRAAAAAVGAGRGAGRARISLLHADGRRYRGTVIEKSMLSSGVYLVRFDDGEQLSVDLREQQRLGRVTVLVHG